MAAEVRFSKKKYEELNEVIDDKNKVILYLLSKNKISIDELCQLKVSDVNEKGIANVELLGREQVALGRYIKGSKMITSLDDPLFPSRDKNNRMLTPHKFKISFSRICNKAGIDPLEVGVCLTEKKEELDDSNIDMGMVLSIIQEKINKING